LSTGRQVKSYAPHTRKAALTILSCMKPALAAQFQKALRFKATAVIKAY